MVLGSISQFRGIVAALRRCVSFAGGGIFLARRCASFACRRIFLARRCVSFADGWLFLRRRWGSFADGWLFSDRRSGFSAGGCPFSPCRLGFFAGTGRLQASRRVGFAGRCPVPEGRCASVACSLGSRRSRCRRLPDGRLRRASVRGNAARRSVRRARRGASVRGQHVPFACGRASVVRRFPGHRGGCWIEAARGARRPPHSQRAAPYRSQTSGGSSLFIASK